MDDPGQNDGNAHDATLLDPAVTDAGTGPLAIGSQFAGYSIEGVAGHGGMGVVYRARQLRPSRTVALKVISSALASDPDFRERFAHESELAASIEHSNVIPVYEVGEESDLLYIVMRFVDGTDLRTILKAEGRLEPQRALEILSGLTGALDAAHARGLVHRDVKPGNVLIAREGNRDHVYLTDFGLAKLGSSGSRTRTGMFIGTLDYAAPEQIEGGPVDARTDVYSAGCVLYEMLTGTVPFAKDHEAAIMWAHISSEPPSARNAVPSLPAEIDAVIARAMAKKPDDRYSSAGDLARAAAAAFHGEHATLTERSVATGLAAPASAPSSPPAFLAEPEPPKRRSGLVMAASGIAALVLVGVVLAVSGVFSSSGKAKLGTTTRHAQTTASSTAASSVSTYINTKAAVSFQYPAQWQRLTLKGTVVDFGTGSGSSETRCALEVQRGAGPKSNSQEARFAFVRNRSQIAASQSKSYQLRAIQAEPAVNTTGVGLIRVADGQGGHLGFFFQGRDVYVFDCVTAAAQLDQVSKHEFEPLLRSFAFT